MRSLPAKIGLSVVLLVSLGVSYTVKAAGFGDGLEQTSFVKAAEEIYKDASTNQSLLNNLHPILEKVAGLNAIVDQDGSTWGPKEVASAFDALMDLDLRLASAKSVAIRQRVREAASHLINTILEKHESTTESRLFLLRNSIESMATRVLKTFKENINYEIETNPQSKRVQTLTQMTQDSLSQRPEVLNQLMAGLDAETAYKFGDSVSQEMGVKVRSKMNIASLKAVFYSLMPGVAVGSGVGAFAHSLGADPFITTFLAIASTMLSTSFSTQIVSNIRRRQDSYYRSRYDRSAFDDPSFEFLDLGKLLFQVDRKGLPELGPTKFVTSVNGILALTASDDISIQQRVTDLSQIIKTDGPFWSSVEMGQALFSLTELNSRLVQNKAAPELRTSVRKVGSDLVSIMLKGHSTTADSRSAFIGKTFEIFSQAVVEKLRIAMELEIARDPNSEKLALLKNITTNRHVEYNSSVYEKLMQEFGFSPTSEFASSVAWELRERSDVSDDRTLVRNSAITYVGSMVAIGSAILASGDYILATVVAPLSALIPTYFYYKFALARLEKNIDKPLDRPMDQYEIGSGVRNLDSSRLTAIAFAQCQAKLSGLEAGAQTP